MLLRGGAIVRNQVADSIGTGWRDKSEWGGAIGRNTQLGIKAACTEAGAYCERVDEQIFEESILERIYNQISKADILVADMTGRNPNVFYEVGYAHALDKTVFLLTQNSDDIPFDLKHYPHIVYGGRINELKNELTKRIRWAIEHPKDAETFLRTSIEPFINRVPLTENPRINYLTKLPSTDQLPLEVSFHNSTKDTIEPVSFQVGIVTSDQVDQRFFRSEISRQYIMLSDKEMLTLIDSTIEILPGSWDKFKITLLSREKNAWKAGVEERMTLRVFSYNGTQDYPFSIKVEALNS